MEGLKEMRCPLCGGNQQTTIGDRVRFDKKADVLRCEHCSLIYLDQGSFELPGDFYESQYHQTYLTHIDPTALDPRSYYEKMLKASRPWSERICRMLTGTEVILDFGCSTGHLIEGIRACAKETYGYEINKKEVEFCRDTLGLDVSDEPLDRRFRGVLFDYIIMLFVLEHIADPIGLLEYLKGFLKPDGKIVILVPNAKDPLVSFYDIPEFVRFYFCIEHLFYFTPRTLGLLLERAGMKGESETIQEYPITNHLNWGYLKKPSDILSSRRSVPAVPLADEALMPSWESFWVRMDRAYKDYLQDLGFGDRIWCVAGKGDY